MLRNYNFHDIKYGAVTGRGSKFLTKNEGIKFINEVAAIVEGSIKINNNIASIIEIGGQTAKYITEFSEDDKSRINISINSDCSAGTGSFLEEQVSRMNLNLEDYSTYVNKAKSIPRIAGRCSVFAKTDITHHHQNGVSVEDILLGLAYAVVKNYKGTVMKKLSVKKPILFIGGVAYNQGIIRALKDILNLAEGELIIPKYFSNVGAIGTSLIAKRDNLKIDLERLLNNLEKEEEGHSYDDEIKLPSLSSYGKNDSLNKHICKPMVNNVSKIDCYLGADVGSTSTNLVLINKDNEIISYKYLKTFGKSKESVKIGLKELEEETASEINVLGVGVTGSGRYMIGKFLGADVIKDEITAQARAAVMLDKDVDTIFEIGGQDSKFINLENGCVRDFQMNKICAAGTGSFIEEQGKKLNIVMNDFGDIALNSENPINLGERCTVFIESSIATYLSREAKIEDIASGLCYSIVRNYLNRVVGHKKIGKKIFFQGGLAYNQGVINAFRVITGKEVFVPPFFSVSGAYGAAILTKEEMKEGKSKFKGFDIENDKQYQDNKVKADEKIQTFDKTERLYLQNYEGLKDKNKKTIGIPRVLFFFKIFPMLNVLFKKMGFNVLLSDLTDEEIISLSQEYSSDETCYPVKLVNGHVAKLIKKNVDYIFFPRLYTVNPPMSKARQNYSCVYMQIAPEIVKQTMELEKKGIKLISPTISTKYGKLNVIKTLFGLGKELGKGLLRTAYAIAAGLLTVKRVSKESKTIGQELVRELKPNEKAFVIITRPYGELDPVLNMEIPKKLSKMGYKVLTLANLPINKHDISKEYPNMYWSFGKHILSGAQIVKQHPNLYAVYITYHGCGPDTILSHYFREEMTGKPYLHIEIDEHFSNVGVITRIEAFINSLNSEKAPAKVVGDLELYSEKVVHKKANIKSGFNMLADKAILYLPYLYPYSEIFKEILISRGINAQVLPMTNKESIEIGRRFTISKEYFSLTAILGDVFKKVAESKGEKIGFIIPRSEGSETDGQYNRLLRTKLNKEGFKKVDIIAPFIEDFLYKDKKEREMIYLGLLAGDIVRIADQKSRTRYLKEIIALIKDNRFRLDNLKEICKKLYKELKIRKNKKRILIVGEPLILFNDFLNDFSFKNIEDEGNRIVYSPLSEYMWQIWKDFLIENKNKDKSILLQRLDEFRDNIYAISGCLLEESPFEKDLDSLINTADKTIKYYSGGNGRYRQAKLLSGLQNIDGIITAASMYENTNTILSILYKGFAREGSKSVLNLTYDGNRNEVNETKIESFMYYIRG